MKNGRRHLIHMSKIAFGLSCGAQIQSSKEQKSERNADQITYVAETIQNEWKTIAKSRPCCTWIWAVFPILFFHFELLWNVMHYAILYFRVRWRSTIFKIVRESEIDRFSLVSYAFQYLY